MSQHYDAADAELEEIVAYLDGELTGDASARVERRLASDEAYRQQLQGVERAWSALGELPMATVDDRFSRTTMSMVVAAAAEEVQARTRALPIVRRRRWVTTALASAVAAALGFLIFRLAWHDPNKLLLADLPVIDNIDIYSQFQDVSFLRMLQRELGDELERLTGDAFDLDAREQHFADVTAPERGEAWLGALDDEERMTLLAKLNRFRELSEAEQNRLRALHRQIVSADDARRLERTMLAYQQWLGGLPPVRQFELRMIDDPRDRIVQIERWAGQMRDDELLTLTDAELQAFFTDLRRPIMRLRQEVTRDDRDGDRDRLKMLLGQEFARWRRELVEQFDEGRGGRRTWFYVAVLNALPERSRDRFASLPPHEKVERFLTWMRQHTACKGGVTQEELEEFFAEELNPEVRAQLLSMPPGEMVAALRRMYRCQPTPDADGKLTWLPDAAGDGGETARNETAGGESASTDDSHGQTDGVRGDDRGRDARGGGDNRDRRDGDWRGDGGRGGDRRGSPLGPRPGFRPPMDFGGPNPAGFAPLGPSGPPSRGDGSRRPEPPRTSPPQN
jgi:hypothetical protein